MIRVAIVGASGYTGAELVRLLAQHPQVKIVAVTSETYAGQLLNQLYPALGVSGNVRLTKLSETPISAEVVEVVFLALPHGESMQLTPGWLKAGLKVIDLSGDFRFSDTAVYEAWYKHAHSARDLAAQAVYGMPELFRNQIAGAQLVANPGCYVTAAVLALYPLVKHGVVNTQYLIVDAKSGVSGAGRNPKPDNLFNRVSENIIPYKMAGTHQHTPEMEQALSQATGKDVLITFSPHLVPARRGIVATAYGSLKQAMTTADIIKLYQETYANEPFVRVCNEQDPWPDMACCVGSNYCVVKAAVDLRTQQVVAVGALDNLIKGASGQAIQNLNLLFGFDETLGLPKTGLVP